MSEVHTQWVADGKYLVVNRVQDVEPILERNKVLRGIAQPSDWGRHVATIPNVILERWFNEEWQRGNVSIRTGMLSQISRNPGRLSRRSHLIHAIEGSRHSREADTSRYNKEQSR